MSQYSRWPTSSGGGGTGTVTSVSFTASPVFTVSGSPITTSGTITLSLATEPANTFLAGPTSGADDQPTFRAITSADLPAGTGTVTSVALSAPVEFTISGSPVTTSGTLTFTKANQSANLVYSGPSSGGAAAPTFRSLVAADIPALSYVTSVAFTAPSIFSVSGSPVTSSGTIALTLTTESANLVFAGPTSGGAATPTFRSIVAADLPTIQIAGGGTGQTTASAAFNALSPITSTGDLIVGNGVNSATRLGIGTSGQLLTVSGGTAVWVSPATSGTVTSVALSAPAIFTVSGSPVTTSGTLTLTLANETANTIWAGPTTGSPAQPTFRALVTADLPAGTGTVTSVALTVPSFLNIAGSPITTSGTLAISLTNESANQIFAGPTSGGATTPTFRSLVAADIPLISLTTGVSGILPIANGGTNASSASSAFNNLSPVTSTGDLIIGNGVNSNTRLAIGSAAQVLTVSGGTAVWASPATSGTVTSVALTVPAIFSVSGSPITSSGTLAISLATETANTVWSGPTSGGAATPTFRTLVAADIPLISLTTGVSGILPIGNGGTNASSATTGFNNLSPVTSTGDLIIGNGVNSNTRLAIGSTAQVLTVSGGTAVWAAPATSGTVTSVALAVPAIFSVSGSPVTSSGTITINLATETANTVWAGPTSGGATTPTFRTLVAADIPLISLTTGVSGVLPIANGGTNASTASTAFNNLSPNTTLGDITYYDSGTNARLAGNTTAAQQFLSQTGTGTVSAAPVWSAVAVGNVAGLNLEYYGDGSDGNVTISSGTTTLTRDMYYNNLTISGTGALNPSACRVYVAGTLDITAAPAGAITRVGNSGTAGSTAGGAGGAGSTPGNATIGGGGGAVAAGAGGSFGNGSAGGSGATSSVVMGGVGGTGGTGGLGTANSGGTGGTVGVVTVQALRRPESNLLRGVTLLNGGQGGGGGGGGAGDNAAGNGGGGGGAGTGGSILFLAANTINRGGSTTASAITVVGGNGAAGATLVTNNTGGGGGGSGGGGGWIILMYNTLLGSTAANALDATGGSGGTGGSANTVNQTGGGGDGGGSGGGGRITVMNLTTGVVVETGVTASVAGTAHSGKTGGAGGTPTSQKVSL